ncbi:hypothetical protein ACHAW5_010744 [Stephanodiscus triporus]|uniref:Uncharacterized protein n=1 Tax=Stephanodiscus triporus TaxID=2934178 RepID=A0ABD3NY55_9STRA
MTTVRAGGKDVILPADGFDAFVDYVFNTPSQPELCEMKKEDIVTAIRIEPTVAATNDAYPRKKVTAAPLSSRDQMKKSNPKSTSSSDNAGTIVEDDQKAKHARPNDSEEDGDDEAYRRPYLFRLSSSYLESINKQSLILDYSDSRSNKSEVGGDSSAWSFSAVGADDDTYASIEDASNANGPYDITALSATNDKLFHNVMRFEEKVPDESDEPVVNKPYFLKYSSSNWDTQSERSGQNDDNASTWSFSAVGTDNETHVSGRSR